MSIELVTEPYVKIVAQSVMDPLALDDFVNNHGLKEMAKTGQDTPVARIIDDALTEETSLDLLSEFAGRFCYRSWGKGRSNADYLANVISEKHGNVLAHSSVSFIVAGVSRSLTHELIRHHVGTNPSQESQRYVTAEGGEIEVVGYKAMRAIVPPMILHLAGRAEEDHCGRQGILNTFTADFMAALNVYDRWLHAIKAGLSSDLGPTLAKKRANEAARCFLPNAAETRLVWTMNMRAARNVCEQRGNEHADLEIRRLAVAFVHELKRAAPETMRDFTVYRAPDGFDAVSCLHSKV